MKEDSFEIVTEGTYQDERYTAALQAFYFKVDEKEIPDFWIYISELAKLYNYYGRNNEVEGDWLPFFESDININIAIISKFSFKPYLDSYTNIVENIKHSTTIDEAVYELERHFQLFAAVADILKQWQYRFSKNQKNTAFARQINESMRGVDEQLIHLKSMANVFSEIFPSIRINMAHLNISDSAEKNHPKVYNYNITDSDFDKIVNAIPYFDSIFDELRRTFIQLASAAHRYINDIVLSSHSYAPHTGLVYTFLNLYKHLQRHINTFTQRHLDFYYKEVLAIRPKSMVPDKVNVFFDIIPTVNELFINKNAQLEVAKEGNEETVYYNIDEDIILNRAKVADLKTISIIDDILVSPVHPDDSPVIGKQMYQATISNPLPDKINADTESWSLLGEVHTDYAHDKSQKNEFADIGIMVASPLLYLKEGERQVEVFIHIEKTSFESIFKAYVSDFSKFASSYQTKPINYAQELLTKAFVLRYTTPDGWASIGRYSIASSSFSSNESYLHIVFNLEPEDKAFDIYKPKIHGDDFPTRWPVLQLRINNFSSFYPYTFLSGLIIDKIEIKARVKGFHALKLQNSVGIVSPVNPFQVFGPIPTIGSFLNIANTNIFNKYNNSFNINIEWLDIPRENGGFTTYFEAYNAGITNNSFKFILSTLKGNRFVPERKDQQVFNLFQVNKTETGDFLSATLAVNNIDVKKLEFVNDLLLDEEENTQIYDLKDGVIKMEFAAPQEGFGHKLFPQILPEVLINNSKKRNKKLPTPNPPYTPFIKSITIDYTLTVSETIKNINQKSEDDYGVQLMHIHPFGYNNIYPDIANSENHLIPNFDGANNLMIGISDLWPRQVLNLLFQLDESNFKNTQGNLSEIKWSYLSYNKWVAFALQDVIDDDTNNFINTGIVKLQTRDDINNDNTLMPKGLYWIKAYTENPSKINSRGIGIFTNAVSATRQIPDMDKELSSLTLAPGKILGFKLKTPGIFTVWQPFHSYGGKLKEADKYYQVRISERLKHKQRPLSIADFEKLALDQFPELLVVKCVGANSADTSLITSGSIRLIVLPKNVIEGSNTNMEPKVNLATLIAIKKYLSEYVSPFVSVEVGNPRFERVKVICSVKFKDSSLQMQGNYLKQLNIAIRQFICPWYYGVAGATAKIGGSIFKNDILNQIRKLPYIDSVSGFSMVHFFEKQNQNEYGPVYDISDTAREDIRTISGSSVDSVLISADDHLITTVGNKLVSETEKSGIGNLVIGKEFIVTQYHTSKAPDDKVDKPRDDGELFNLLIRTF